MDNTGEVCADYRSVLDRYLKGDAPELLAYQRLLADAYQGRGQATEVKTARAAYFRAWARDTRPVADRASNPDLKAALQREIDALYATADGAADPDEIDPAWQRASDICPGPSLTPSPTR